MGVLGNGMAAVAGFARGLAPGEGRACGLWPGEGRGGLGQEAKVPGLMPTNPSVCSGSWTNGSEMMG